MFGVRVSNITIGATYVDPEWFLANDYGMVLPPGFATLINEEDKTLGRNPMPASFSITKYGKFKNLWGKEVEVDGVVYQYSLNSNPRNVHYAFKTFCGGQKIAENSGLRSIHEAKEKCNQEAETLIREKLYDII